MHDATGVAKTGTAEGFMPDLSAPDAKRGYNRFLLLVAGLGGLLYGVDVGIIGGALPYLEATSRLTAGQLSIIVAAVLLGSVISTLFAGLLADWMGRKALMTVSGLAFVVSIPIIALSQGYEPLFFGRLLQGISGGLIGVVVPLYLAECLTAAHRGKGTAVFQWLLTLGIVLAALIGIYYSYRVQSVTRVADAATLFAFKDQAWRRIFWVSLPPGILFVIGSFFVAESPRWLFVKGRKERAYAALLRSRTLEQADTELKEMEETALAKSSAAPGKQIGSSKQIKDSLLRRKYVIPFLLGLRHSFLQHRDRHQLGRCLQHEHPLAERPFRSPRTLGICHLHVRQFPDDDLRHDADRSQGPQVSLHDGHRGRHCVHDRCGTAVYVHRAGEPGLPKHCASDGRP